MCTWADVAHVGLGAEPVVSYLARSPAFLFAFNPGWVLHRRQGGPADARSELQPERQLPDTLRLPLRRRPRQPAVSAAPAAQQIHKDLI
jgi:hypothetical protein